jgi:hypothetical protein
MAKKCSLFGKRVDNLAKTKISAIFDKIVGLCQECRAELFLAHCQKCRSAVLRKVAEVAVR